MKETKMIKKITGIVKSGDTNKTRVVAVVSKRPHPMYHKILPTTSTYLVHDEDNTSQVGDRVQIIQTRPTSKNKAWKIFKETK